MKKLLVFFVSLIILVFYFGNCNTVALGYECDNLVVNCENNSYKLNLNVNKNSSTLQKELNNAYKEDILKAIKKIINMGFTTEQAVNYIFPNFEQSVQNIIDKEQVLPTDASVYADNNNCKILFKNEKNGKKINKKCIYEDFLNYLCTNQEFVIKTEEYLPTKYLENVKKDFKLVSTFSTSYKNSSAARANNILLACQAINGKLIKSGEEFSFNDNTGKRTLENGYKEAKIIKDGEYIDGFGGGVCQVSTTLYNACIRAGLVATEVHNHSFPASYVAPCFDAMVSMGSADLKLLNKTGSDFIITASALDGVCKVCIYGVPHNFDIQTRYAKYQDLPALEDKVVTDSSKFDGEYIVGINRISYGVPGFRAKGYLDYYKDGILIKSEQVRDNTYKSKQGVVLLIE